MARAVRVGQGASDVANRISGVEFRVGGSSMIDMTHRFSPFEGPPTPISPTLKYGAPHSARSLTRLGVPDRPSAPCRCRWVCRAYKSSPIPRGRHCCELKTLYCILDRLKVLGSS